ncbi:MAG: family 10 glycosylhydrolase [Nostoc sp.]|uniref:family 10 glycosylhydrolase n=1 Tax=Nostoc sp. TaxID=1180 RepID=UPI002FF59830
MRSPPQPKSGLLLTTQISKACSQIKTLQGDDRFPAFPSEGGYEQKTVERYQQEFNQLPPVNSKDPQWLQWRADILSNFLTRVYREIISINSESIISLAPSVYPWSSENYLSVSL